MKEDNLNKRVFVCLVLVLMAIFLSGCHSVRFQWFPDNESEDPWKKDPKTINVLKVGGK